MVVTSSPDKRSGSNSLSSRMDADFLEKIKQDFSDFKFISGRKFAFRPPKTIVIGPSEPQDKLLLLHELGHAVSGHKKFGTDVERLKMEVEAWEKTKELAPKYGISIDDDLIQNELDTYRDWLHSKSKCKKCGLTCYQTPDGKYHCPRCENLI